MHERTIEEQVRQQLRSRSDCRFVEPAEFCTLLISTQQLRREDHQAGSVRGLIDPATGQTLLVEEEKLDAYLELSDHQQLASSGA